MKNNKSAKPRSQSKRKPRSRAAIKQARNETSGFLNLDTVRETGSFIVASPVGDSGSFHANSPFSYLGVHPSRLATLFEIFESYQVNELRYTFVPSVSALDPGTVYMAFDYDVHDAFPLNEETQISAMTGSVSGPLRNQLTLRVRNPRVAGVPYKSTLYCDALGEPRTNTFGKLLFYATGATSSLASIGHIKLQYDVTFIMRQTIPRQMIETAEMDALRVVTDTRSQLPMTATNLPSHQNTEQAYVQTQSLGSASTHKCAGVIYTALVDAGNTVIRNGLDLLQEGARIFFRMHPYQIAADGGLSPHNYVYDLSSDVGEMSISSAFSPGTHLTITPQPGVPSDLPLGSFRSIMASQV